MKKRQRATQKAFGQLVANNPEMREHLQDNQRSGISTIVLGSSDRPVVDTLMICKRCNTWARSQKCGSCGITYYCSRECQAKDWPRHKTLCRQTNEPAQLVASLFGEMRKQVRDRFESDHLELGKLYLIDATPESAMRSTQRPEPVPLNFVVKKGLPSLPPDFKDLVNLLVILRAPMGVHLSCGTTPIERYLLRFTHSSKVCPIVVGEGGPQINVSVVNAKDLGL
jgi:hypothetical protein